MVSKYKYAILTLVIFAILITNVWRFFPDGEVSFILDLREEKVTIGRLWFVQLLIYHIQFLLLLISVYLLSLTKIVRYISVVAIAYQFIYILDYILTFNYNETLPIIFAVIATSLTLILTKWKK